MCGRFTLVTPFMVVTERFHSAAPRNLHPRYNIAPGQDVLCVIRAGENRIEPLRWGLIPSWAKDPAIGNRMINTRAETVAEKPSFRNAFEKRRCFVVADGFYEWRKTGKGKVPVYITLRSKSLFGLAGLYEIWIAPDGQEIRTCTIITTDSNDLVRPFHARMPVILPQDAEDRWLDPRENDRVHLQALLRSYPAEEMDAYDVATVVNSTRHDEPDWIEPATPPA
jgi:putative SOS response-associated peptidase YedK